MRRNGHANINPNSKAMRANKRTDAQRAADDILFEYYALRGYNSWRIKEIVDANRPYSLSTTQINNSLIAIRQRWREEATAELQGFVDAELAGLKKQEDELWAAWERSQRDAESETTETLKVKGGRSLKGQKRKGKDVVRVTKQRSGQVGGVQFQNAILEIRNQRRTLLGLDQPKKIASTTPDGKDSAPLVVCVTAEEMPKAKQA